MSKHHPRTATPPAEQLSLAAPPADAPAVVRKRNIIIGTNMPYIAPKALSPVVTFGYRPRKRISRPPVQPNPV